MKFIPMLFALSVGGVCYADAMGWIDGTPYSLMHPKSKPHVHKIEIDLTDAPKAEKELGEIVVTKTIDWVMLGRATMTGDTGDETEEEKRLFWHTTWGENVGVPFGGWGDPDPLNYTVWSATHSPDNPGFHFIDDPAPPRNSDTLTLTPKMGAKITEFLHNSTLPETMIDGDIGVQEGRRHHHRHHPLDPIAMQPDNPLTPIDESKFPVIPVLPGGQISDPLGAPIPEPRTWVMLVVGFILMAYSYRVRSRKSFAAVS